MAKFSEKVRAKLEGKGIATDDVEFVLDSPERGFPSRNSERHMYSRHIGSRLLLVVVESFDHDDVVTAYYQIPERKR